ncbi:MAG: hypothetical protein K8R38_06535, partial [Verrucomicrobia bacterium]|nr:hypothetical protein [Verrucomicrobiota bacterium]
RRRVPISRASVGVFLPWGGFLADHAEKIHTPHHAIEINRKISTLKFFWGHKTSAYLPLYP